jgi:hypothetical protein
MKTVNIIVGAVTVLLVIVFSAAGPRPEKAPPAYNPATEVTVSGSVVETREFFCPIGDDQGIHVVLHTPQSVMLVHVAPARFLRAQEFQFHQGEQLEVVGVGLNFQQQDAMLAREITRGNEVLIVRDHQGRPLWMK